MLTYANMNMKKTGKNYGARTCIRLMLNILKEMIGPIPIYTHLEIKLKNVSKEAFMYASSKEVFKNLPNSKSIMNLLKLN
jgi:heterodisulfide reductase subunit B